MLDMFQENSIKSIAISLPRELVKTYDKKEYYSPSEVESVFLSLYESTTHIEHAFAMFCSPLDFSQIAEIRAFNKSYKELRLEVSDACFDGWPRFNFDSLLSLTDDNTIPELVSEITEIGFKLL